MSANQNFQTEVIAQLGAISQELREVGKSMAEIKTKVENIETGMDNNRTDHGKIFDRLGETEKCLEGIKVKTGVIGSIVGGTTGIIAGIAAGLLGKHLGA